MIRCFITFALFLTAEIAPAIASPDIAAQCPKATPAQIAQAERILSYFTAAEADFFSVIGDLNADRSKITREFDVDDAWYGVTVMRGAVAEKAAFMANIRRAAAPPFIPKPCFHRYIDVNVHPVTPYVGFMHATIHFALNADGKSQIGGTMLLAPAVRIEEDISEIRNRIDGVFAEHSADVERYRLGICSGYRKNNLQTACAGVSFYRPPGLEVTAANVDLVIDSYQAMVDEYFRVLKLRKDQDYGPAEIAERDAMRLRWFKDQLLNDRFVVELIPWDVWTLTNQAPEIRF